MMRKCYQKMWYDAIDWSKRSLSFAVAYFVNAASVRVKSGGKIRAILSWEYVALANVIGNPFLEINSSLFD